MPTKTTRTSKTSSAKTNRPNTTKAKNNTTKKSTKKASSSTKVAKTTKQTVAKTTKNSDLHKIKELLKKPNSTSNILALGLDLATITFDKESIELIIKANNYSPFVFYSFPFNEIKNWRELIKQNPNLALQNRMLVAMDEVNYFSKNSLTEFKEKYDDLLKIKFFYNHFIEYAKNCVEQRVMDIKESRNVAKIIESLNYMEQAFKKYKFLNNFILPSNLNEQIDKQLMKKLKEIEVQIDADFDNLLLPPENLTELIHFINIKFDDMMVK